jgi:hypothetical protein
MAVELYRDKVGIILPTVITPLQVAVMLVNSAEAAQMGAVGLSVTRRSRYRLCRGPKNSAPMSRGVAGTSVRATPECLTTFSQACTMARIA